MSLHRRNPRRDANEGQIVAALRAVGAIVKPLSAKGVADLLCLYRGKIYLLEVKTRRGKATEAQADAAAEGWPVATVRDEQQALEAIGAITASLSLQKSRVFFT